MVQDIRFPLVLQTGPLRCRAMRRYISDLVADCRGCATEKWHMSRCKDFYLAPVECAVLSGLEAEMRNPRVMAEYVRTYHDERKCLAAKSNAKRAQLELRLGEINREIDRLVDAIAKGHGDPAVLGPRSSLLDEERRINTGYSEATEAIRDLVETVTVFRDLTRPGGVTLEIAGRWERW